MKREKWQKHLDFDHSLLHLMRAIARAHAITLATNLKRPKKNTLHFCLWQLFLG